MALLKILQLGTFPPGVQQQASIQFKNFVAKRWDLVSGGDGRKSKPVPHFARAHRSKAIHKPSQTVIKLP